MRTLRLLFPVTILACSGGLFAQAPPSFTYQAVARDLDGDALGGLAIAVRFHLHQGTAAGTVVFAEQHSSTTNDHGLFTLQVGNGTPITGTLDVVDWGNGPWFLEVSLDDSLNGTFTSMGTQQLLSVPYALHATSSGDVPDGTEVGQIMHWTGSAWVADSGLYVHQRRFGIGITQPEAPLGIKSRNGLYNEFQNGDIPNESDFRISTGGNTGLSFDQDTSGGFATRLAINSSTGHVGIGTNDPPAPLSIVSRNVLKTYFQTGDFPTQEQFAIRTDSTGFDIGQGLPNNITSRFFIDRVSQGNIGIGTILPQEKLHIESSTPNGITGIRLLNTASSSNEGWTIGHLHDNGVTERMKTFAIQEKKGADLLERITILTSGNVGINEPLPDAKFHVSRPASDPLAAVALAENTGIMVLGPINEDNLVLDSKQIQARHGEYIGGGSTLALSSSELGLQPLGGDLTVHGSSLLDAEKVLITNDGKLGLGTVTPVEKLHVNGAIVIGDAATVAPADGTIRYNGTDFEGWTAGDWAIFNGTVWEKVDNSDHIYYDTGTTPRVGIGTGTPNTTLHVSRPVADPQTQVALAENTGIVVFGPMTDNVAFDHRGIQARQGVYLGGGSTLSLTTADLDLQRLGGNILIHGDDALGSSRVIVTDEGNLGLGTITPLERIDIDGAIKIGTTTTANDGTIRFTGSDFEGRKGGSWVSLTAGNGPWSIGLGNTIYYAPTSAPRVGIGTSTPGARLHVRDSDATSGSSVAATVHNEASTSSTSPSDHRVGLKVSSSGTWGGDALSKNIGIYVSQVSGQTSASSNLAAVLNGNVVLGDVTGSQAVGAGGAKVLAIQNGTAPSSSIGASNGTTNDGVQLYVTTDALGVSVLHVMNGNGEVIQLYRLAALTTADAAPVDATYDGSEAAVINNMRTRIDQLETKLQALGLLH